MIGVTVHGAGRIRGRLTKSASGLDARMTKAIEGFAEDVVLIAKDEVAVESGKTRDSIRVETVGKNVFIIVDRGGDRPIVPIVLEFGSRFMAARPFLAPALRLGISQGLLKKNVKEVGGLIV